MTRALTEICLMLLTAGSPAEGREVIINAEGIYQYVAPWEWQSTVDNLCSLDNFSDVIDREIVSDEFIGDKVADTWLELN